ncbi:MAG: VTT domain-containing protein [Methanolinea sp.]|jgi:membrane-associated protein
MISPDLLSLSAILLNIENVIPQLMETYGILIYAILFAIIFCETGLVFAPFLPGDSLLFLVGFFAAGGGLNIGILLILHSIAAISGDSLNYWIGNIFGDRLIHGKRCLVDRRHVEVTRQYFHKYGKKTIILARFVPYIRSFAPFITGIVKMDYPVFLSNNIIGGILWVTGFISLGYLVASLPLFSENQDLFLWAILIISIGICLLMMYNFRKTIKECQVPPDALTDDLSKELRQE